MLTRTLLAVVFAGSIFFSSGYAQKQEIDLGAHAGVNVNILSTSLPDFTTHAFAGLRVGVFPRFCFGAFQIQPEINFSMQGSDGVFANNPNRYYSAKTNTLEIPVIFGIRAVNSKLVKFRINFGGFWAWNITNSLVVHDEVFTQNDSLIVSRDGAQFNGGVVVGAGLDIWNFTLDFRYQWGLANLLGDNLIYQDPRAGLRYSAFSATLGYKFYAKKF